MSAQEQGSSSGPSAPQTTDFSDGQPPSMPQVQQQPQQLQQPPQQQQQQQQQQQPQGPAYPSLAYPSAGPSHSQPPPHFQQQQQQQWYNPYYQYPQGPGRPPHGNNFQQGYNPYGAFPYQQQQQFYPQQFGHPMPGPGPNTMQNGYYAQQGYPRPYFEGGDAEDGQQAAGGFQPHMGFQQPYYPPGHPYAYGVGVGYQQQMPFPPNGGGGGAYRPDNASHHQQHHTPSKGLNPAAQGFTYVPPARKEPQPNGSIPNGSASTHTPSAIPPLQPENGSLGLSLEPAAEPQKPVDPPAAEPATATIKEAVKEETAAVEEIPVDKQATVPDQVPASVEQPQAEDVSPKALNFLGPSLDGIAAPSPVEAWLVSDPIRLRPSCPGPDDEGVHFASHLKDSVPASVSVKHVGGRPRKRSSAGYPTPKGKPVFAAGNRGVEPVTLVFGTISNPPDELLHSTPLDPATVVLPPSFPSPSIPSTPTLSTPAPSTPAPSTPATIASPPQQTAPRVKPSSWAALVRGPKAKATGTPDSQSIAPSSTLVSPSKSVMSLPSDAVSTPGPASPGSVTASLTNGPTSSQPRAAFNYAAAAAVGAPLSPAEDLARLITDGLPARRGRLPSPVVPRGLINTGNMCFANTILQVLVYCTPFTELFEELGKRLKADLARRTPLLEAMVIFLREFIPGSLTNGGSVSSGTSTPRGKTREDAAFVPENVYDAMKENKRFDSMRRGFQEDAEEYLGFFLNTLHEELLATYSRTQPPQAVSKQHVANGDSERTIGRPVSPGAGESADDWLEVGKRQKTHVVRAAESRESAVSRIFGGSLRSVLHAPGQKDSVTLEPYQPLQLDIQAPEVNNIVDALRHLNEPETVPGVWVQARGANVDATKQVYLETFPPVLILHLKRFVYDPQEQNVVKKAKPIAYGTELVIPQDVISASKRTGPVKYRLFGVVYHHGYSATGGHYTVSVSRPDGTGWLHFDDESVQPVPVEDVVVSDEDARSSRAGTVGGREKCAYLLFYQRVK